MDPRSPLVAGLWILLRTRFERWERVMGPEPWGTQAQPAAANFIAAMRDLGSEEVAHAIASLPAHRFSGDRSAWFIPTAFDIIDLARSIPSQELAIAQYLRRNLNFLDSRFGRLMRTAALEVPEGRAVSEGAHFATLDVTDEFALKRAYTLAAHWLRTSNVLENSVEVQLRSLPSREQVIEHRSAPSSKASPGYELLRTKPRSGVTPAGLDMIDGLSKRFGISRSGPTM